MPHLLIWSLSPDLKIILQCQNANLETITHCSQLDMLLQHKNESYFILDQIRSHQLKDFQTELKLLITNSKQVICFMNTLQLKRDQLNQILIEIYFQEKLLSCSIVDTETIASWDAQIDLLHVVMQENENEQKDRGNGCCS